MKPELKCSVCNTEKLPLVAILGVSIYIRCKACLETYEKPAPTADRIQVKGPIWFFRDHFVTGNWTWFHIDNEDGLLSIDSDNGEPFTPRVSDLDEIARIMRLAKPRSNPCPSAGELPL